MGMRFRRIAFPRDRKVQMARQRGGEWNQWFADTRADNRSASSAGADAAPNRSAQRQAPRLATVWRLPFALPIFGSRRNDNVSPLNVSGMAWRLQAL